MLVTYKNACKIYNINQNCLAMFYRRECSIFYLLFNGIFCGIISNLQIHPPTPAKFGLNPDAYIGSGSRSRSFTSKNEGFEWEESGFFEGDIMTYKTDSRNGLLNEDFRWANATIPFYIEEKHFEDEQIEIILESIKEFNEKTCVRFRPFMKTDDHWVIITGKARGCWSPVGMKGQGGQQLNINSKKCLRKGTIMHEMLHSAGFFHQQSAADRDKFVKINWENIVDGHEGNFNKFDSDKITNYGIEYDYNSIMHYSGKVQK